MDNSTTLKVHSEAIASKSKCFAPSNTHHHITTLNSLLTPTAKQGLANPPQVSLTMSATCMSTTAQQSSTYRTTIIIKFRIISRERLPWIKNMDLLMATDSLFNFKMTASS